MRLPVSMTPPARLAVAADDFLELHAADGFDDLHERLWTLLARRFRLHSCSLYLNYFGEDREFQVLHQQAAPGGPMPWPLRRQLSPARRFLQVNVGIRLYGLENLIPDRDRLEGSAYFRQVMQAEGWGALLSLCIWRDDHPETILTMRKSLGAGDFSPPDIEWVEALRPHFEVAFRRIQAAQSNSRPLEHAAALLEQLPAGILLLAADRSIALQTSRAKRMCMQWNALGQCDTRPPSDSENVPAPIMAAVAEIESGAASLMEARGPHAEGVRIIGPSYLSASIRPTWLGREPQRVRGTLIVLEAAQVDTAGPEAHPGDLADTPLAAMLSPREYVVARMVAAGLTNDEIAAQLYKSVNTIKSQVASSLRKLKLARRIDLVRLWHRQSSEACGAPPNAPLSRIDTCQSPRTRLLRLSVANSKFCA